MWYLVILAQIQDLKKTAGYAKLCFTITVHLHSPCVVLPMSVLFNGGMLTSITSGDDIALETLYYKTGRRRSKQYS